MNSHRGTAGNARRKHCSLCASKIIFWCIIGNTFLALLKLVGGVQVRSPGLVADGMQSLSCVIGGLIIMYSMAISQKKRDALFPYGYGKIEFLISFVVFSCLFAIGIFIFISSSILMLRRDLTTPDIMGLPLATLSVLLNYMMYKFSLCAGKKIQSSAMMANAHQNRVDMLSSCAVCAGIILAQLGNGFAIFDPLAALVVGVMIVKDSFHYWFVNLQVILDTTPEPGYQRTIRRILSEVPQGPPPRFIEVRRTGKNYWLGIGVDIQQDATVSDMEKMTGKIRNLIRQRVDWVDHVEFFLDIPEDEKLDAVLEDSCRIR